MCFLHNEKIVHRDLKPQNLLLDIKNNIKIADFGLSRMFFSHQSSRSSNTKSNHRACGTPAYMAPELFSEYLKRRSSRSSLVLESKEEHVVDERIDFLTGVRADVYAFGITLAAMLLPGTQPYPSLETMNAIAIHVRCGYRISLPRNCPSEIAKLIRMCWNAKASERPTFTMISQRLQDIDELLTSSESPRRRKSFGGHTDFYDSAVVLDDDDDDDGFVVSEDKNNEEVNCTTVRIDLSKRSDDDSVTTTSGENLSMALKNFS